MGMPRIRLKLEKLIRSLREHLSSLTSSSSPLKPLTISLELLQRYPFMIELINKFLNRFLSNWVSNVASTSKDAFRYTKSLKKGFATCGYILGDTNLYEFIRLNIPGSVPNLTSLRLMFSSSKHRFIEGEFQYSSFQESVQPLDCKYAFCGEDSTSVIPKVSYDFRSNSFVGFKLLSQALEKY